MKLPINWLKELVPGCRSSAARISELLTFSGTEVEGDERVGDDRVLTCAVTSNRVDCLCVTGLARDVAAVIRNDLVTPSTEVALDGGPTAEVLAVSVEDPAFCRRYVAFVVEGIKVGPSPEWLQSRLRAMGLEPINNVVDITNLVLFELNQPLHAFDADRIGSGRIIVRRARKDEKLTALNGREYALDPGIGVIADAQVPLAIAGVMGGIASSVTASTRRIVIESAWFDPISIRRTSRALGLASDSSHRFERGIDAAGSWLAASRAARLVVELAGGTVRRAPLDIGGPPPERSPIELRRERIREVTGVLVPNAMVKEILVALGCRVESRSDLKEVYVVSPPTWRRDLEREIDLIEEVIRIRGLDHVPSGSGLRVATVKPHPERTLVEALKDRFVSMGFLETVTPPFVRSGVEAETALLGTGAGLCARNPVRAGEGHLRRSLMPSLLEVRRHNQDQGVGGPLRLFEVGALSFGVVGQVLPERVPALGFQLDGDLRDGRGVVEALGDLLGVPLVFEPHANPAFAVGLSLAVTTGGVRLGVLGPIAPVWTEHLRLKTPCVYGELDLRALLPTWKPVKTFAGLPRFPAVERDFAFVVPEAATFGALEACVHGSGIAEIESVAFFDEFRGAQLGIAKKSLAIRVVFRSSSQTLTTEAVERFSSAIVAAAARGLGAALRA